MKKIRESNQELNLLKKEVLKIVGIADSFNVAIACDDDLFWAHRVILSAKSSLLVNILSDDLAPENRVLV